MTARTSELLAVELDKVGLRGMAQMAREDKFHDFLSPFDLPEMELVDMLRVAGAECPDAMRRMAIINLRDRVIKGDFDADLKESEEWAQSPEGQEAYRDLLGRKEK